VPAGSSSAPPACARCSDAGASLRRGHRQNRHLRHQAHLPALSSGPLARAGAGALGQGPSTPLPAGCSLSPEAAVRRLRQRGAAPALSCCAPMPRRSISQGAAAGARSHCCRRPEASKSSSNNSSSHSGSALLASLTCGGVKGSGGWRGRGGKGQGWGGGEGKGCCWSARGRRGGGGLWKQLALLPLPLLALPLLASPLHCRSLPWPQPPARPQPTDSSPSHTATHATSQPDWPCHTSPQPHIATAPQPRSPSHRPLTSDPKELEARRRAVVVAGGYEERRRATGGARRPSMRCRRCGRASSGKASRRVKSADYVCGAAAVQEERAHPNII
jgi:hypothetical protein